MKAFVITIMNLDLSVNSAQRTISTASDKANLTVEHFAATTPQDDPIKQLLDFGIPALAFKQDKGSRTPNVIATFLSHYKLWLECYRLKEEFIIFEHDAVVIDNIPKFQPYQGCLSIGAPSYGSSKYPDKLGVSPLFSKEYFPGAHAYRIKPSAAQIFIENASFAAQATDIYLNRRSFPFLEEYFPWPVIVKDTFTTIQNETGCQAKHNYHKGYKIVKI